MYLLFVSLAFKLSELWKSMVICYLFITALVSSLLLKTTGSSLEIEMCSVVKNT